MINPNNTSSEPGIMARNARRAAMETKKAELQAKLTSLQHQRAELVAASQLAAQSEILTPGSDDQTTLRAVASAKHVVKDHIALLHRYNEIKDIGQGLMGLLAEESGALMATVMKDYDMDEED